MPTLTLLSYWRSSSSYRVRLALALKGLDYELKPVNLLRGDQHSSTHKRLSPMGFVPCLVINGEPFVESVALIELLEELHPIPALLPRTPHDRARVRALVEIVNAGTQPLQNLSILDHLSKDRDVRNAWSRHFIARGLEAFETMMQSNESSGTRGRYAFGDVPTIADCYLVPQVYNARRFEVALKSYPRLAAAADALLSIDAVRKAIPENQPDAVM